MRTQTSPTRTRNQNRVYGSSQEVLETEKNFEKELHFEDGQKVEIEIRLLDAYGFSSRYGWTAVIIFETKCGKQVKYLGTSPSKEWATSERFVKVEAKVMHKDGETRIKNIKTK
jgi:hypothetical protein